MRKVVSLLNRIAREERGGEVLEYALVAGLVSVVAIALIASFGRKVLVRWNVVDGGL